MITEQQQGQVNVLLVDDRPENLLAMESTLADLGHRLVRANSGREALRLLLEKEYALILLDVEMPGLDGFELAELIRERESTERTPIIFITAVSKHEEYIFKGYSLGAVDYLTKPFDPEILKSKVKVFTELYKQNRKIKHQAALLEQANNKLDRANVELEARVRERTAQLQKVNKDLEAEMAIRAEAEARLATEHNITRTLADANDLDEAAPAILRAFCDNLGADIALLWLVTDDRKVLACTQTAVADETDGFSSFINESKRIHLEPNVGLPGTVWAKREPVWLGDTVQNNSFPRAKFAASVGLNSGIGFPIIVGRQIYGVIEIFTRKALPYNEPLINMVGAIGSEIGQFIIRKRAESERERLLQREKSLREQAENASRMKDEFLATVSHELRTPLNSILGWCQMLNERSLTESEQDRALETIYRNAKAQSQLIDDLLDTSRLITGNLRLNLSPTNVPALINDVIDIVRPAAEGKKIQLSREYNAAVKSITCDPQRLQQMVWNLLTNSVKFTHAGGAINVRVEQSGDDLQIIVSDTGQGIIPEFLPYVFDRFRQQDSSITRRAGGLGIGLAVVRHLAELHGGSVSVASEGEGKGATFTITLPIAFVSKEILEEISPPKTNGTSPNTNEVITLTDVRVLVVDDDKDTRDMMTYILKHWGAQAQASGSVDEALTALSEWLPDIILADLSMPIEDGYSLLRKVRADESKEKANIPIIALTAHAHPEESKKALSAGFQMHLTKPVDVQKLAEAIMQFTEKQA